MMKTQSNSFCLNIGVDALKVAGLSALNFRESTKNHEQSKTYWPAEALDADLQYIL